MKTHIILLTAFVCIALFQSCNSETNSQKDPENQDVEKMSTQSLVERGEYLVLLSGCDHCHTPKKMTDQGPVPDMDRWLMGYPSGDPLPEITKEALGPGKWVLFNGDLTAAVGPWGVSFSANLTPSESGIGNWSYENFKKSMTEGKHKGMEGTRMVLPPMPWQSLGIIKEDDLKAIYEYLKTINPIENVVPPPIPPDGI
ncbi:MAG: diheme cytochrome c-553 [Saprospiraceae bacterium]|nr:diheme cytochrome c-553 [Bacteroidia bacterium]NNF20763.1 diheme cytochrome c-553 [Saprospiraceae bacterium]